MTGLSALIKAAQLDGPPILALFITDAGVDLDDEFALIEAAALQRLGVITVLAVTANMKPVIDRSCLVRGTLTQLGYGSDLPDIPVGMGLGMIEKRNGEPCPTKENCPYLASREELHVGDERFVEILLDARPHSVVLILQSGFADAMMMAYAYPQLMKAKIREAIIMGGVEVDEASAAIVLNRGLMVPNDANNNTFNAPAAQLFYTWCQQHNVPMVITTRFAAMAAQVPFSLYDMITSYPSPIGACLQQRQIPSIRKLWQRANAAPGSEERGPLPPSRDRKWFVDTFCAGRDPVGIGADADIAPHLGYFNLYDPLNLLAAIPAFRSALFEPVIVRVDQTDHMLIGATKPVSGIKNAALTRELMTNLIEAGISAALPSLAGVR